MTATYANSPNVSHLSTRTVRSYENVTWQTMDSTPKPTTYSAAMWPPSEQAHALAHRADVGGDVDGVGHHQQPHEQQREPARAQILAMLAPSPSPVTQPMRADSIWMPIISGVVNSSVHTRPKRNCEPICE